MTKTHESQYICFVKDETPHKRKTDIWHVYTCETPWHYLGFIKWKSSWRRYAFHPNRDTLFEQTCLRDISQFLDTLMTERKMKKETPHDKRVQTANVL